MRKPRKTLFLTGFLLLGFAAFAQTRMQVKVIVNNAGIRSQPDSGAEILDIVAKDALIEVLEKTGPWYRIVMGTDPAGKVVYGYIHESMVEPVGVPAPEPRAAAETERVPPPPPPIQEPTDKLMSGSFIKVGFGDHWLASFGFDLGLGRHLGLGLEIQPYYSRDSDLDVSVLQIDVFLNAKLGFNLWLFTLYGGCGLGPDLSFTMAEIEGQTSSKFNSRLTCHGILGLALDIGGVAVVFEFQPIMVPDQKLGRDAWGRFFFVGLRF